MKRALCAAWLVLGLAGVGWAQEHPHEHDHATERSAHEQDKPAVFGYMISEFFHQRYTEGPGPVWKAAGFVVVLDMLLLVGLMRRRDWSR